MTKQNCILIITAVILLLISFSVTGMATEEFAAKTGAGCRICHIDPLGGGDLTATGQGYYLSISQGAEQGRANKGPISRIFKLIIGYIHIVTAFMWFGTILYVHLVLKPAYASTGLPRGEVKVGLASMAIMAVTGAILTYYRVPSFHLLLSSPFGILLLVKIVIFSTMVLSAIFVVLVIGPKLKNGKTIRQSKSGQLTLAELANFDGEDGRPAYLAYQNTVYDVSRSALWKTGNHMKRHHAGVDLTGILPQAPHGEDKILAMPVVGKLADDAECHPVEIPKKVFYFMAYMNLGFVFVIALILALWRWY